MKKQLIIIILVACSINMRGQVYSKNYYNCILNLKNAEVLYLSGQYPRCIITLENYLDSCEVSRKNKQKALESLARAYVEIGEKEKAETTIGILLKNFPLYELKETENPEMFNRIVKKFQIHPLLTIGAKNTANWLRHKVIKVNSVLPTLDYSRPFNNEKGYFFTYYGYVEYEFIKDMSLSIDAMAFYSRYYSNISKDPSFNLSYSESDDFMEFPVYIKKYFHASKNFLFYASAGFGPFINYRSKGTVTVSYRKADISITGKDADFDGELTYINMLPVHNILTGQWNAGAGLGYTFKNLRFFLDMRYLGGVGSFTAPEKSNKIPELRNDFFYVDNSLKLNQFEIGATISYTFINSVKRIKKYK